MGKDGNLQLDTATGKWKKPKKEKDDNKDDKKDDSIGKDVTQIVKSVDSIMQGVSSLGIDVPAGITKVLGVMQLILGIMSAIQTILVVMGVKSSIPFFANGGLVGRAAGGMLIPGNSFSGDNLRMPVADGGVIGLNSGELILNKAQQDTIASHLENQQVAIMQPYVDGEKIFLGMNNTSQRMGRGEIVTTQTLKRLGLI
jgi:hypothetical protein